MAGRAASMEGWSHARTVCALYKRLLKSQRDWLVERPLINDVARQTRFVLDERKGETKPHLIQQFVKELQAECQLWDHPQPYIIITDRGGTSYERNTPQPLAVCDPSAFAREYGE